LISRCVHATGIHVIGWLVNSIRRTIDDGTLRRFLFVAAVAFWIGGFTFYGSIVIPTGIQVLHGHVKQGFITQQVTNWLNLSGVIGLPILLWNTLAFGGSEGPGRDGCFY
jgi:hypothetical protein